VAHIVFIDSSRVGLQALSTARRIGHKATLIAPGDVSFLALMRVDPDLVRDHAGDPDNIVAIDSMERDLDAAIDRIAAETGIDAILTTSEAAVLPTARTAARIGLPYDPPAALDRAVFKDKCRRTLAETAIPSIPYGTAADLDGARAELARIGYPAVIKPTRGVAKEASAILENDRDLQDFFAAIGRGEKMSEGIDRFLSARFVIEGYIVGDLYSAEVINIDGRLQSLCIWRRERAAHNPILEVAAAMPSGLAAETEGIVIAYLQDVFTALGLCIGIYHVEFILGPDGPILVEINPRIMGGPAPILYRHLTGADPYELLIDLHLGKLGDFVPPAATGGGVIIAVGAPAGGLAPPDAETIIATILQDYHVIQNLLRIGNGTRLTRFDGNFSHSGALVVAAPDGPTAMGQAKDILERLSLGLGVELAQIA